MQNTHHAWKGQGRLGSWDFGCHDESFLWGCQFWIFGDLVYLWVYLIFGHLATKLVFDKELTIVPCSFLFARQINQVDLLGSDVNPETVPSWWTCQVGERRFSWPGQKVSDNLKPDEVFRFSWPGEKVSDNLKPD